MNQSLTAILGLYNDKAPLEEAHTIPAPWYVDPAIAALEQQQVFGGTWQAIGRIDQVAKHGDYFTTELAGEPILAVRDADGVLRAFYNVCRHHAAAVATAPCGQAQSFRCPYHGWNYGLDGTLKGTPEFTGVCNFDRSSNGLVPLAIDTWENFVFINLTPNPSSLHHFLGNMMERVTPLNLNSLQFHSQRSYTLNCNWKVYVDNYLDGGYHVPHLHKGLNSVLDYTRYTIENGEHYCLQSSPMVASDKDAAIATTRKGNRAHYFWLYPNFMINIYEGVTDTNLVLPLGPDKCRVVFDFFFTHIDEEHEEHNAASIATSDKVQDEDLAICESVQRGLTSRAYIAGRLSVRREAGEHLFHRLLAHSLKNESAS
ncbi:aromatic ring-hydroxylating oxygenase subunit alpha [Acidicapsa ligni]|uniref:aromatic ring-hydroxylating oxygenase subunit alpha n=1 Tax=Acidicapsa ligni TaxID=542300 RepID=UPI0021E05C6B|nr:aromatic ring-hydroxylating dioxygenase subunit alpha [Acidicapsa ligni]